jgi:hypothetical protein
MPVTLSGSTGLTLQSSSQRVKGFAGQVVTVDIAARYTLSSTSFAAFGPTLSITPKSSTSAILIMCTLSMEVPYTRFTFFRNGSDVISFIGDHHGARNGIKTWGAGTGWRNYNISWLDYPGTTSSVTYQLAGEVTSGTALFNDYAADNKSQLIAIEMMGE